MKVGILGPPPTDRGGIAQQSRLLARSLEVNLAGYFSFSRRYPRWLDPRRFDELPPAGAPAFRVNATFDYASPASWAKTAGAVRASGAERLLVPWWTSFWAIPVAGLFSRLEIEAPEIFRVLLCHNVVEHESSPLRKFLSLRVFRRAHSFVVHSPEDRERLAEICPGVPAVCLPHPVERRVCPDRDESRRRLGVDRPLVLLLGLVRRYKGIETLVSAAPSITSGGARIAIVGEIFRDARPIRDLIAASPARDRILLIDRYLDEAEMDTWLAASDVVVCPYRKISGSGIAARAVAAGRPVVASDLPGFRLLLSDRTGALVPPSEPEALADAVLRVIALGVDSFGPALAEVARRCSWSAYISALLGFLRSSGKFEDGSVFSPIC